MVEALGAIETTSTAEGYTGVGFRNATRSQRFIDAGIRGQSDPQVAWRVALVESRQGASFANNWIATDHVAFQTAAGASRIAVNMNCTTDPCTPATATGPGTATSDTHGTRVAALAAGGIEEGQDPVFPGSSTTAQIQRSGSATQSQIAYYSGKSCADFARAVQQAVMDGAHVINMSLAIDSANTASICGRTYDCGGMNAVLRAALDGGAIFVKSAGNGGVGDGSCSLTYPAQRPEALTISGLGTGDDQLTPYNTTKFAEGASGLAGSSQGAVRIQYNLGGATWIDSMAGVALTAPMLLTQTPDRGPNSYQSVQNSNGTSFSAAVTSGAALLVRQALFNQYDASMSMRRVLTNMLLMGDGMNSYLGYPGQLAEIPHGVSEQVGYGRLRAHWPSSADLTAPWGWGDRQFVAPAGVAVRWPVETAAAEDPAVTQWKWATAIFPNNLDAVDTDYVIEVVDTCAPVQGGGTTEQVVDSDYSFDIRKRIQLTHEKICPPDRPTCRCLEMRLTVFGAPAGGTMFYSADYYHSGDVTDH